MNIKLVLKTVSHLILPVLVCLSFNAAANPLTGSELSNELNQPDSVAKLHGITFVQGVWDGIMVTQFSNDQQTICVPAHINLDNVVDIVKAQLQKDQNKNHLAAAMHVYVALYRSWPCSKFQ